MTKLHHRRHAIVTLPHTTRATACSHVQIHVGTPIAIVARVVNFFMVGSEMVRWEISAVGTDKCRLMVTHSNGTIVEYFSTSAQALDREREIESLFFKSRGTEVVHPS